MSRERSQSPSSFIEKIDEIVHTPLQEFDAFPKLPETYKARSESRGFLTLFVTFLAFLLVLNDLGEYIWGWPDYEFSVDRVAENNMKINLDMVVNMPCQFLSVDLRDAVGDRLYLSSGFSRDGTLFDIGQATALKEHAAALSARQAVAQSRKSRGFFSTLFRKSVDGYRPTFNHQPSGSACRIYGSIPVKKVTANLHITTLGHGYASHQHVDHKLMNLSHVITEFSFGPYFPDITQPLDNSFELTQDPFVAYQYFLNVVPTTYIAPRSKPLYTYQYSVTHYTRLLEHNKGVPGIFFKFDLDPMSLSIHQRTTSLLQLLIRCVGVVGGVFVCMGYAVRITTHAVDVVTGADRAPVLVAEASGVRRQSLFGGGDLHKRGARSHDWGGSAPGSPYASYAGSPALSGGFPSPYLAPASPAGFGLGLSSPGFGPASPAVQTAATAGSPYAPSSGLPSPYAPSAPSPYAPSGASSPAGMYAHFPPTPNPASGPGAGFPSASAGPPPRKENGHHPVNGGHGAKKDD